MNIVKTISRGNGFAQLEVDGNLLPMNAILILSKKEIKENIIDMNFVRKEIEEYDTFLKKTNRG